MVSLRKVIDNPRHYIWLAATKSLPNYLPFNYALTVREFRAFHGRWPRHPDHPEATFNDYVYHRMIRCGWSDLEHHIVDKQHAKGYAIFLCPEIGITETAEVLNLSLISENDFLIEVGKFKGQPFVAKTTYASGDTIFLRKATDEQIRKLYRLKNWHHFHAMRETQYAPLQKNIIIERELPEGGATDYKFFCARGEAFACQINIDRFGDHRKVIVSVPDFEMTGASFDVPKPDAVQRRPPAYDAMIAAAQKLSKPFEFVRIDLYDTSDGIFFGEFTFTPDASRGFHDNEFCVDLLRKIKLANHSNHFP